jgi:dTMP kinase
MRSLIITELIAILPVYESAWPLLRARYIVLADRYVYTAYARDIVRGSSPTWVRKVYDFAIKPDATFYFRVPNGPYDSYRIFQSRIIEQYESMIKSEGFIVIDGTSGIEEQQQLVRETISKLQEPIQQPTRL